MILVISLPFLIYTSKENLQWLSIYSTEAIHSLDKLSDILFLQKQKKVA